MFHDKRVARSRYDFECHLAADGCSAPLDAGCHDRGDHVGAQRPGLVVGWLVDLPTHRAREGEFGSAASDKAGWGSMAVGLCLGFGNHFAGLRAVQCVES